MKTTFTLLGLLFFFSLTTFAQSRGRSVQVVINNPQGTVYGGYDENGYPVYNQGYPNNYPVYGQGNPNTYPATYPGNCNQSNSRRHQSRNYINILSQDEFGYVIQSIDSKPFDDNKLVIADQVLATHYLYSWQVRDIMNEFVFDRAKVNFAKRAYSHVLDPENYYQVNDALTFSSSINELNRSLYARNW